MGIRLRLYEYWQLVWKKWSVRFTALGLLLQGYLLSAPDAVINMWAMLPPDLRDILPIEYSRYLSFTLFLLALASNYIQQDKLKKERLALEAKE